MKRSWQLELDVTSSAVRRAAWLLLRDRRVRFVPRLLGSALPARGPVLRLEPGSRAYGLVSVLWGEDEPREDTAQQAAVGSSRAVWAPGGGRESWQDIARPLPGRASYGTPDFERPWVLLGQGAAWQPDAVARHTGLTNAQPHLLDPRGLRAPDAVWWLSTRRTLRSLLGHVDALIAEPGPLTWDAARVGLPTWSADGVAAPASALESRRLARLVPESLVGDADFWRQLVDDLLRGDCSLWGTQQWLELARERAAARERAWPQRLKRKLGKLRRDPRGVWAEARRRRAERD